MNFDQMIRMTAMLCGNMKSSEDVSPGIAMHDVRDIRLRRGEHRGDIFLQYSEREKTSDLANIGLGQPREVASLTLPHQTSAVGVREVFGIRAVLQIAKPVVRFNPVDVVDVQIARPDESGHHQPVDDAPLTMGFFRSVKHYAPVPALANNLAKDATEAPRTAARHVSHSSKRRDFVQSFVVGNCAPFFGGKVSGSHGEPPSKVPVVRPGWGATNSPSGRFHFTTLEVAA